MIRKPQMQAHARVPSVSCPRAKRFGQHLFAGQSCSLLLCLLLGATLSPASYAEEAEAAPQEAPQLTPQPTPQPAPQATPAANLGAPNWQQWQLASESAEAIVDNEVNDSGLLIDAIADESEAGLKLDEDELASYGTSASWLLRGEPYFIDTIDLGPRQVGISSWYGPGFNGRRTASGEIFNMHQLTAAHRTLPLPSYIRVTNLSNNRVVIVKVNDRGPYHGKRMLDLSYAAAQALGFKGVAKVSIEPVDQGRTGHLRKGKALDSSEVYRVRLGNFRNADLAHDLESRLLTIIPKGVGIDVIKEREPEQAYRVSIGPLLTREEAVLIIRGLRAQRVGLMMNIAIRPSPEE